MRRHWTFTFGASTSYADGNYMDTYFGVRREDALRSGLDDYNADGGIKDVGARPSAHYTPWKRWGILGGVNYYRLVGDADDASPVADEGSENQIQRRAGRYLQVLRERSAWTSRGNLVVRSPLAGELARS